MKARKEVSFVWDTETRPGNLLDKINHNTVLTRKGLSTKGDPLVCIGLMRLYRQEFVWYNWNQRDKFIKYLIDLPERKVELLAHNSKFDTSALWLDLLKLVNFKCYSNKLNISKEDKKHNHMILVWSGGLGKSTLFLVEVRLPSLKKVLIFRDTAPLFAYRSLKELAASFLGKYKLKKGDYDYTKIKRGDTKAKTNSLNKGLIEYLKNDCLILKLLLRNKELKEVYGTRNAFSLVATQYKKLVETVKDKVNLNDWDKGSGISYNEIKLSYKGGLTTYNQSLKDIPIPLVYYYDIVSAYPNAMKTRIPTERSKTRCYGTVCNHLLYMSVEIELKDKFKRITGGIHARVFKPNESVKEEERYHQIYLESGMIVMWESEWIIAKRFYNIKSITLIKRYHFKTEPVLKEYITNLFSKKQKAKLKQLLGKAWVYKIILNSLYGKTGENPLRISKILSKDESLKIDNKVRAVYHQIYCFKEEERKWDGTDRDDIRKDIAVASLICSDVRVRILKLILYLGTKFVMCDTDSIVSLIKIPESKEFRLSTELGDWELKIRRHFKMIKSKTYCYLESGGLEIKANGLDKEWLKKAYQLNNKWNCGDVRCLLSKFNLDNLLTKIPNKQTKRNEWGTFFYDRTASAYKTKQWTIQLPVCNHAI